MQLMKTLWEQLPVPGRSMHGKNVCVLVGDFVEDHESWIVIQALQTYGLNVYTVSPDKNPGGSCQCVMHYQLEGDQSYTERRGHELYINGIFQTAHMQNFDCLYIPGGRCCERLSANDSVLRLVNSFIDAGKPVAAMCHGALVLAAADVVRGRRISTIRECKAAVECAGGIFVDAMEQEACLKDGLIISAGDTPMPENARMARSIAMELGVRFENFNRRVLIMTGDFVEDLQTMGCYQIMKSCGFTVETCSPGKQQGQWVKTVCHVPSNKLSGNLELEGYRFPITMDFNRVNPQDFHCMIIPGGRAPEYLQGEDKALQLVREFHAAGKVVAAFCRGVLVLGTAGILSGKTVTGVPTIKNQLQFSGMKEFKVPSDPFTAHVDANIVTGVTHMGTPAFLHCCIEAMGCKITEAA